MVFDFKDYNQAKELILDIGKDEKILWKGKMDYALYRPVSTEKINVFIRLCFYLLFFTLLTVVLVTQFYWVALFTCLSLGGILFFQQHNNLKTKRETQRIFDYTEYIITEQRIVFLLYKQGQFHLHFLPFSDIKKVELEKEGANTGNIRFRTHYPMSFRSDFVNFPTSPISPDSDTQKLEIPRFVHIDAPDKIATLINRYL